MQFVVGAMKEIGSERNLCLGRRLEPVRKEVKSKVINQKGKVLKSNPILTVHIKLIFCVHMDKQ